MPRLSARFAALALPFAVVAPAHAAPLSLDEARQLLRERNPNVLAGEAAVQQTELLDAQARTLLRPSVAANVTYTLRDQEIAFESPNVYAPLGPYLDAVRNGVDPTLPDPQLFTAAPGVSAIVQFRHDIRGSLTVTQSLFNARALSLIEQARITISQSANRVDQTVYQLEGALVQAWFGAVSLRRFLAIAERNLLLATLNYERAQAAYELGTGNLFEVNRNQVEVASAQRDIANAEASYRIALREIAGLLALDSIEDIVEPPELSPSIADQDPLEGVAQRRPDLAGYDLQVAFSTEGIREKRLQWLPTFGAQAAGNLQRANAFAGDRFIWTLSVYMNWTLYDGGLLRTERESRELDIVIAERQRDATLVQLRAEVDRLRGEVEQARNNLELAAAQRDLAARNVDLTAAAYELGAATNLDTQLAQQQLYLSELAFADAEVTMQSSLYRLRHVTAADWTQRAR